jgi:hypothetical protein
MQIILKRSLCAAPPSPVNQESPRRDELGILPPRFYTGNLKLEVEIAGRAKPRPNRLGSVERPYAGERAVVHS